ncbi:MAG TPA: TIGR03118 family protein [Bryobacteraceae bacterium]|nr:TIGR03118 family protein [Bryobacteraceae bacterium]
MKKCYVRCALTLLVAPISLFADVYTQTNLVSDLSTVGAVTVDPNLTNPWGISFSSTSPFWVSNERSGTSTLYNGAGVKTALTVTVPPSAPTGQVFNAAGTGNFMVNGTASNFIFDTLAGTINAWNNVPTGNTVATALVTTPGAVYTGLAMGNNGTANYLYASNFTAGGGINVFDSNFSQVNSTTFAGKFVDPNLPAGYAPFNIQLVGNSLYVEYAEVGTTPGNATRGTGLGFVDVYDLNGNLSSHLIASGGQLNAPWGVVIAPAGFGQFSGDLLVGNFGNGTINAFNPSTGAFLGTIDGTNGSPLVNGNLWALEARPNGGSSSNPNAVYFDAGINGQVDGIFGEITFTPEPAAYGSVALGLTLLCGFIAFTRRRAARQHA